MSIISQEIGAHSKILKGAGEVLIELGWARLYRHMFVPPRASASPACAPSTVPRSATAARSDHQAPDRAYIAEVGYDFVKQYLERLS